MVLRFVMFSNLNGEDLFCLQANSQMVAPLFVGL